MSIHNQDLKLYAPAEVAEALGSTPTAVKRAARENRVPHVRVGGRREIRFKAEHLPAVREALGIEVPAGAAGATITAQSDEQRALALLAGVRSLRAA